MTVRMTITMDDHTAALVKDAAGSNVSDWLATAARKRLLSEEARAVAAAQNTDPATAAAAYDEREAERAEVVESVGRPRRHHGDAA